MRPLAIDLFCGLGGWTEGLLAEGYYVVGFDIERHRYPRTFARQDSELAQKCPVGGSKRNADGESVFKDRSCHLRDTMKGVQVIDGEWNEYPAQLVLQDILTLHGKQFRDAALIVASPPCQEYSYMAMPWSRAKAIAAEYRSGVRDVKKLTALFDACFRIQCEAIEAARHFIPLVVENVRGAQPWVGRSRANYGSYHLWGDVPALMPMTRSATKWGEGQSPGVRFDERPSGNVAAHREGQKNTIQTWSDYGKPGYKAQAFNDQKVPGLRFDGSGKSFQTASVEGLKGVPHRPTGHWTNADENGTKAGAAYRGQCSGWGVAQYTGSKSNARKAASAAIAKIPLTLSRYIAAHYKPTEAP